MRSSQVNVRRKRNKKKNSVRYRSLRSILLIIHEQRIKKWTSLWSFFFCVWFSFFLCVYSQNKIYVCMHRQNKNIYFYRPFFFLVANSFGWARATKISRLDRKDKEKLRRKLKIMQMICFFFGLVLVETTDKNSRPKRKEKRKWMEKKIR